MSSYRFGEPSIIREIELRKSAGGGMRIFLFAGNDITAPQANAIKNVLEQHGMQCVPSEVNRHPCLEVRFVSSIESLESALRTGAFVTGPYTLAASESDIKYTIRERLRSNMLRVTGVLNNIADVGMIAYGYFKKVLEGPDTWEDLAAGAFYWSGSIALTAFGHGDQSDYHVRDIARKLEQKLHDQGISIPVNSAILSFTTDRERGIIDRSVHFLRQHPAETFNTLTAGAGAFIAKGALKSESQETKVMDSLLGGSTLVAGLTSAFVKEQAPDPGKPAPEGVFPRIKVWVQERPNRVAGYGYMISTVIHGFQSGLKLINAHKNYGDGLVGGDSWARRFKKTTLARIAYSMRFGFAAVNMMSEITISLSSKGHGSGIKSDKSIDETAYAVVADAIARQPASLQENLIRDLSANFLTRPDVLGGNAAEIEQAVRARVKNLTSNPWMMDATQVATAPAAPAQQAPSWQEKERNRAEPAATPAFAM